MTKEAQFERAEDATCCCQFQELWKLWKHLLSVSESVLAALICTAEYFGTGLQRNSRAIVPKIGNDQWMKGGRIETEFLK